MCEKEKESIEEIQFHDPFRKEVIDKLLELHYQLILVESIRGSLRIPFLRNIVNLRNFFWDLDVEEHLYYNEDLGYIYDNLERLMEEIKIFVPLPKRTQRKSK